MSTNHGDPHKRVAAPDVERKLKAALLAAALISGLSPLTDNLPSKLLTQYRLEQVLALTLDAISLSSAPISPLFFLASFNFNESADLSKKLDIEFHVDWNSGNNIGLSLTPIYPLRQLAPVPRLKSAVLTIAALNISMPTTTVMSTVSTQVTIPYQNMVIPAQKIILPVPSHPRSISIIATSLTYITMHNKELLPVDHKKWQPVNILDAAYFVN